MEAVAPVEMRQMMVLQGQEDFLEDSLMTLREKFRFIARISKMLCPYKCWLHGCSCNFIFFYIFFIIFIFFIIADILLALLQ
jgi:hypothetical protein